MASSGGGWGTFFKQEWGRGYNFSLKFFLGGFSFETLHFFENYRPPDVINDRSLIDYFKVTFYKILSVSFF